MTERAHRRRADGFDTGQQILGHSAPREVAGDWRRRLAVTPEIDGPHVMVIDQGAGHGREGPAVEAGAVTDDQIAAGSSEVVERHRDTIGGLDQERWVGVGHVVRGSRAACSAGSCRSRSSAVRPPARSGGAVCSLRADRDRNRGDHRRWVRFPVRRWRRRSGAAPHRGRARPRRPLPAHPGVRSTPLRPRSERPTRPRTRNMSSTRPR